MSRWPGGEITHMCPLGDKGPHRQGPCCGHTGSPGAPSTGQGHHPLGPQSAPFMEAPRAVLPRRPHREHSTRATITEVGVEATASGEAFLPVHSKVPLAHHVGGIAGVLEQLGQELLLQRKAAGLAGPDDLMLQPHADLGREMTSNVMSQISGGDT